MKDKIKILEKGSLEEFFDAVEKSDKISSIIVFARPQPNILYVKK